MPRKKNNDQDRLLSSDSTANYEDHSAFLGRDDSNTATSTKRRKIIMASICIVIVLIVIAIGLAIYFKKEEDDKKHDEQIWLNFRLPTSILPITYDIEYTKVDRVNFLFAGIVNISLAIQSATNTIILHANQLNITNIQLNDATGTSMIPKNAFWYEENEYFVIQLDEELAVQSGARLVLNFEGVLNDGMHGFYRSSYIGSDNTLQYLAVTQFEPTDARMAFPCFDEPSFKANFTVRITAETSAEVLSNMLESDITYNADGTKTVSFQTTPLMSTYLVAFAVGELVNRTTHTDDSAQTLIRVFADPQKLNQTSTPLMIASKATTGFSNIIGIPYSLPKQDQLAVNDFSAGAMENWGLITYRETALLYNSTISSEGDLQRAASTIAHEIAHQWTGDLVTMKYWNELWLNEGFATFLSYLGVDAVFPEWSYMDWFVPGSVVGALQVDSSPSSRAIVADVTTDAMISSMFDTITYDKGGSILRMMYYYFTPSAFLRGLNNYLTTLSYKNAQSIQFFDAVNKYNPFAATVNVADVMMPWITQPGYPVLVVSETMDNETDTITYNLNQRRFFSANTDTDSTRWSVPLIWNVMNVSGTVTQSSQIIMADARDGFSFDVSESTLDFVKFNVNQTTFARVQYSKNSWDRLISAINREDFGGLTSDDRTGLWSDAFALGYAGYYAWGDVLEFTRYLSNEKGLSPWTIAMSSLNGLFSLTRNALAADPTDPTVNIFTSYMGSGLLENITCTFRAQGWQSQNDHRTDMLIALIFRSATAYSSCNARADAVVLFQNYMSNYGNASADVTLWPEISSTIYTVGVADGNDREFQFVFDLYSQAQTQADRERFLLGLSSTKNTILLNNLLELSLNSTVVRKGDAATLIRYVSQNPLGFTLTQNFVLRNLTQIDAYLSSGFGGLSRIITAIVAPIADQVSLDAITAKLDKEPIIQNGAAKLVYAQAVASAKQNIAFGTSQLPAIKAWFAAL